MEALLMAKDKKVDSTIKQIPLVFRIGQDLLGNHSANYGICVFQCVCVCVSV